MYKLVLGIIVVGILQFGFVIYTRLQDPIDLALAPVQADAAIGFPDLNWNDRGPALSTDPFSEPDKVAPSLTPRAVQTNFGSANTRFRPFKKHRTVPARPDIPRQALPDDFSTVVISYNAPFERPAPRTKCDQEAPERPKQRTAFAKAEPAAARPWQVITTFSAKQN